MMLSLRTKLFMFVPVFALVPWLGYQTFHKLQHFATQAQSEALRVLAQSLQPELDTVFTARIPTRFPVFPRTHATRANTRWSLR